MYKHIPLASTAVRYIDIYPLSFFQYVFDQEWVKTKKCQFLNKSSCVLNMLNEVILVYLNCCLANSLHGTKNRKVRHKHLRETKGNKYIILVFLY